MKLGPFNITRTRPRGLRPAQPSAVPGSNVFAGQSQWGDIPLPGVSDTVIKGLPAANRALNLIANAVASMSPLELWTPDGYISDDHPNLITRPNVTVGTFAFWWALVAELIMHGTFLGLWADYDSNGYPQQVVPVPHGFGYGYLDEFGYMKFYINGQEYDREEVCYIPINNASSLQVMGTGVVTQFRRQMGAALDMQAYAADLYRTGTVPPMSITMVDETELTDEQARVVVDQVIANHATSAAPLVLPSTMKAETLKWTPEDLQFLAARQHTIGEMAFIFNLDPADLGAAMSGSSAITYQNREQLTQSRIVDTYWPLARRISEEFSDQLPSYQTCQFNPDNLLRTDTKTHAEVQQIEIGTGTLTVEEARKAKGRKPLPKAKSVSPAVEGSPEEEAAETPAEEAAEVAAGTEVPNAAPPKPAPVPGTHIEETPVKVKA